MTKQLYFSWGDMDLSDTLELFPKRKSRPRWDINETAYVKISLYEEEANERKAMIAARKKFIEYCNIKPKFRSASIIEKKEIVLFTSKQIEYTIEIIAHEDAVASYYDNIIIGRQYEDD